MGFRYQLIPKATTSNMKTFAAISALLAVAAADQASHQSIVGHGAVVSHGVQKAHGANHTLVHAAPVVGAALVHGTHAPVHQLFTMLLWFTTHQLFTGQWFMLPQLSHQPQSTDTQVLTPHQCMLLSTVWPMSTLAPTLARMRLVTATPPMDSIVLPFLMAVPRLSPTMLPTRTPAMLRMSSTREWPSMPLPRSRSLTLPLCITLKHADFHS